MSDLTLFGLSGALRAGSFNTQLLLQAASLFGGNFNQGDLNLPLYNADDETSSGIPATVQLLADQIASADAIVIATPEYNKAPSGVLKNALDWISRTEGKPFAGKPVALISATAGRTGGETALGHLRAWMVPFQPRLLLGNEVQIAGSMREFENGSLISERYTATLTTLMTRLRAEASR
ncbi:NADPH-dependent FMN reductase [Candidatus Halocynthiibacter alkanivorans]|uniref:NADPH-dependent FMN reductase n=1 Tax=Candidatus Halocynthiibacter alkanivorans TaxID=2267619 RepID=UPI000DF3D820|nr:NAD(P)H-dependent oxidoreductase [Candidatus Halocynthiibacter alkanivorans]